MCIPTRAYSTRTHNWPLWGFRPTKAQANLLSYRDYLED